jgi:HK97 family phage portal protein
MTERRSIGMRAPASVRSLGPPAAVPDPLSVPPRSDIEPNVNDPVGSVGPNVPLLGDPSAQEGASGGFGATHVIYPASSPPFTPMPWAGWPSEWAVPNWDQGTFGIAGMLDVVFAAVDRNASAFASMPPNAVKGRSRAADQPTWMRNPQPEVYASWHDFAQRLWWGFQVAGEVILLATSRFENSRPRTFFAVNPWLVQVEFVKGVRRYAINGEDVTRDVLHLRYLTVDDDPRGHGPLEAAGERIVAVRALMRYAADLALGGGVPWGVLKSKYRLTEDQANKLKEQWVSSARRRMGAPAVLDGETDLQVTQIQPKDMQLSELQQAAEARLAVLLGVPPYMLALPTHAGSLTYTNATLIYVEHYGFLRTKIAQIGGAMSGWALPWGTELEFDAERYVQPPAAERASYYSTMFAIQDPVTGERAMTVDEIRRAERVDLMEAPS